MESFSGIRIEQVTVKKGPWILFVLTLIGVTAFLFSTPKKDFNQPTALSSTISRVKPSMERPDRASRKDSPSLNSTTDTVSAPIANDAFSKRNESVPYQRDGKYAVYYHDIILGMVDESDTNENGLAQVDRIQLWNSPIAYAISKEVPEPQRIEEAIKYFNENTPVKFTPFAGETDAILFEQADEHCRSFLGKKAAIQPIFISPKCTTHEILHEIMHALGFIHEQSRSDRDDYIEILWENVEPKFLKQFQHAPDLFMENIGASPFDYTSVMLYKPETFAKNPGLPTMKSKNREAILPTQTGLSHSDIERLQRLYGY